MDLVYLFALVACAIQCRHVWRALPLFTLSVAASIAFELAYQPFSLEWLGRWYPWLVAPLLIARVLAVLEAFLLHSRPFPYRGLIAAVAGLLALMFALITANTFTGGSALLSAIGVRRVIIVFLAAFLGTYILLLWTRREWRSGFLSSHIILLFLLCLSMSISSLLRVAYPVGIWHAVNPIAYGVSSLIYLRWAWVLSPPGKQCDQPTPETAH